MTSRNYFVYACLVAGALITLAPFALGLLTAFVGPSVRDVHAAVAQNPPTLANFAALGDAGFRRALLVTALMTAMITLGQLTFRYWPPTFAKLEFRGRDALFWVYIATLMVPATVTVIPLYLMMAETGLRNSFWALVLPLMFGSPCDLPAARILPHHPHRPAQRGATGRGPAPST